MRYVRLTMIPITLALAPSIVLAQRPTRPEAAMSHTHLAVAIEIPESMRVEHAEIHAALERATTVPGRVGEAARRLAKVLHQFTHGASLRAVAFAADGRRLMTAASDGTIRAWDLDTGSHSTAVTVDPSGWDRYMVAFSGDGTRAVSGLGADDVGVDMRVWNLPDGTSAHKFLWPRRVATVALNTDGTWLAAGGWSGDVQLWHDGKEAGSRQ